MIGMESDQWSPCRYDIDSPLVWAAHPVRLFQAALQKPVAGGQPTNIVKNVSRGRVDGGAVPYHLADDAGDRDGSLDDDEQREAGAARSALALLARRLYMWVPDLGLSLRARPV